MEITNFEQWMDTLAEALKRAQSMGMSENAITSSAKELGSYLADNINPDIPENRLLKSLWENGTDSERQALASMVVKLVKERTKH